MPQPQIRRDLQSTNGNGLKRKLSSSAILGTTYPDLVEANGMPFDPCTPSYLWEDSLPTSSSSHTIRSAPSGKDKGLTQHDGCVPQETTVEIIVYHDRECFRIRVTTVWEIPEPLTEVSFRCSDLTLLIKSTGPQLHKHGLNAGNCVGLAKGYAIPKPGCLELYYQVPTAAMLLSMSSSALETCASVISPPREFPSAESFAGRIPCFPPLSVLMGIDWWFAKELMKGTLASIEPLAAMLEENTGEDEVCTWHYSRFEWIDLDPWCGTYLFYSSRNLTGPLSLYPLWKDHSMCKHPPGFKNSSRESRTFMPHFVQLHISLSLSRKSNVHIIKYTDILKAIKRLLRSPECALFESLVRRHGLVFPDLRDVGFEKVMNLMLHFWPPGSAFVGGFWYTHIFEDIAEPNSLCLTASAANVIAHPDVHSNEGALLEKFCMLSEATPSSYSEDTIDQMLQCIEASTLQDWILMKCCMPVPRENLNVRVVDYVHKRLLKESGTIQEQEQMKTQGFTETTNGHSDFQHGRVESSFDGYQKDGVIDKDGKESIEMGNSDETPRRTLLKAMPDIIGDKLRPEFIRLRAEVHLKENGKKK